MCAFQLIDNITIIAQQNIKFCFKRNISQMAFQCCQTNTSNALLSKQIKDTKKFVVPKLKEKQIFSYVLFELRERFFC